MRIAKWVILGLLLLALIFSSLQAFLLSNRVQNLETELDETELAAKAMASLLGNRVQNLEMELSETKLAVETMFRSILPFSPRMAKYHANPVMTRGGVGEWDQYGIGNPIVIWDEEGLWKMWFYGYMDKKCMEHGLGYATSVDGITWTKYADNPVLLGGDNGSWDEMNFCHDFIIRKVKPGDYRLWYEASNTDESRWRLGYATSEDGINWVKYDGNPIIDYVDAGIADKTAAKRLDFGTLLIDLDGKFHLFGSQYRGDKYVPHFISDDGITWTETEGFFLPSSPFCHLEMSDIAILALGGYYYLVSSVRVAQTTEYPQPIFDGFGFVSQDLERWDYIGLLYETEDETPWKYQELEFALGRKGDWRVYFGTSDSEKRGAIGVGLLLTEKSPLTMLRIGSLAESTTTVLTDCTELPLEGARAFTITVECKFDVEATQGIKVHIRSSADEVNYDTEDWDSWTPIFTAGGTVRQTKSYHAAPRFVKVLVENLDASKAVADVKVTAVLSAYGLE